MPHRLEYNQETKTYSYTNTIKDDFDIPEEDIGQSLHTASSVVSHLHDLQRTGIW